MPADRHGSLRFLASVRAKRRARSAFAAKSVQIHALIQHDEYDKSANWIDWTGCLRYNNAV